MGKLKTACAIIENDKNEILLTRRAREPFRGYWGLISGVGESKKGIPPEIGIIEDVCCDLGTNSFKGKYLFSLPIEKDKMTDEVVVFVGNINKDEIKIQPEFSQEIKWVSKNNPKEFENLAFEHSQIIKRYLENF